MAQKNKVKELVGRGLHSYHTKALQQIHRIEKKNKEQNHKISILSNELDNDYLTKTEEGSVISLEHSKEGMVYLDELQGNTLVNYCSDGSKEMTLNGDIDVEGTFVTTTEGVDNGKVDVLCEGNTLVNYFDRTKFMIPKNTQHTINGRYQIQSIQTLPTKVGDKVYFRTKFSVDEFNTTSATPKVCVLFTGGWRQTVKNFIDCRIGDKEEVSIIREHPQNLESQPNMLLEFGMYGEMPSDVESGNIVCKYTVYDYVSYNLTQMFGKGNEPTQEWCDKNLPYIEGMKSVGQDDESGHKIEILSNNQNQFRKDLVQNLHNGSSWINENSFRTSVNNQSWSGFNYYLDRKKKYWLTYKVNSSITEGEPNTSRVVWYDSKGVLRQWRNPNNTNERVGGIITDAEKIHFGVISIPNTTNELEILDIQITEIETNTYQPTKYNKKEILINEPLRGLPNGVKDKIVKIGGKWYIERNCKVATVDDLNVSVGYRFDDYNTCSIVANLKTSNALINRSNPTMMCNTIPHYIKHNYGAYTEYNYISLWADNTAFFVCQIRGLSSVEEYYDYFRNNNCLFLYPLAKPTYEEIIDMELTTYLDITHISNNSIIPCNMVVKNSGYNAIIKPSTLYTVALDTNKSGTIGLNLGGAKVTTTNNVATVTTPATLTDDSLRLYGKGIKGSKVRLLEGDKTNWIPSFFEGMKSSFEDKLQDDGSYKMEILSSNENLFNVDALIANQRDNKNRIKLSKLDNGFRMTTLVSDTWLASNTMLKLKPNKRYKIKFKTKNDGVLGSIKFWTPNPFWVAFDYGIHNGNQEYEYNFTTNKEGEIHIQLNTTRDIAGQSTIDITDISITELNHVENKSNKIQFSSIEPLRSVGNVRDRFVFKNNKLMIERNCRQALGSELNYTRVHNPAFTDRFSIQSSLNDCVKSHSKENMMICNVLPCKSNGFDMNYDCISSHLSNDGVYINLNRNMWGYNGSNAREILERFIQETNLTLTVQRKEPIYEEIPFELQKIILEGYENGTLFFDTNIPPTSTVTYAGETPIVKSLKLNKTEVLNNTNDINDNIIPYLCDMDYRVVLLQLTTGNISNISMARLFGSSYEMLKRDIMSKRYSKEEYLERVQSYYELNKVSEDEKIHLLELIERV